MNKKTKNRLWFAFFTFPAVFSFLVVVVIPFLMGIAYSFVEWDGIAANPMKFVGFQNYVSLFSDARFGQSAGHTILFTVIALFTINIIGLGMALLVTSKIRTRNIARTMYFMPYLIGGLILGYIWKFIFTDAFEFLGNATGLENIFFNWLASPKFAMYALVIVFTWQMAGYTMIVYITGIEAVPEDVMEAASIDGANGMQRFVKIQLPLIMPSVTICLFLTLSNCFKIFDVNLSLTGGGPGTSTEMFAMNIYNEIFGYNNFGYGQAKAIVFVILVAAVSLTQVAISKRKEVQM